ncbi:DPY30 domain-containing protein 2 [Microcebus murinus]|uniref:DPY30 domain containing 2 n=1 Tax=Microcebus murinus TaxID=30608 RepID=A0A8B7G6N0_MICMU|nr:DPY30 domain-containing protein 2 [Microcebus murinus]XP_012617962.1 DPY30 domain-containing protein 2 [Microcebus murinus]XP_012617963.1 DPY30 domain-containing protein 2 [Microcebus murinus]XP_012617964.1 DPY30 domain-containing protein 2 [Microcebus murinus]
MESEYLRRCFGNSLTQALVEVAKVRPSDPIEYLAHWLYHCRKTTRAREENRQEKIQLKEEYDSSCREREMTEMLKQEEWQMHQKCKCGKELFSETVSSKKTVFMQEDTKPLEKEALEQESLRGAPSVIPGEPQQASPSESAGQADWKPPTPQELNHQEALQYEVAYEMPSGSKSPP